METAFVGPGRAGLGHATGRNGPGPKLNSGPRAGPAGPGRAVRSTGRAGPGRADKIRPVQTSASNNMLMTQLYILGTNVNANFSDCFNSFLDSESP